MSEKLIARVLTAVENGCANSAEIAEELSISVKAASASLSELRDIGMIRPTGSIRTGKRGPASTMYERAR